MGLRFSLGMWSSGIAPSLFAASIVSLACGSGEPSAEIVTRAAVPVPSRPARERVAVRAEDALRSSIATMRARAAEGDLPAYGTTEYVDPPSEDELAWIGDPRSPISDRIGRGMALFEDTKTVAAAYMTSDQRDPRGVVGVATLTWLESIVRISGRMARLVVDELLPSRMEDGTDDEAVRTEGLRGVADGARQMLTGTLMLFGDRRSDLDARRHLARAWSEHASDFAKIWDRSRCGDASLALNAFANLEPDEDIRRSVRATFGGLANCSGGVP